MIILRVPNQIFNVSMYELTYTFERMGGGTPYTPTFGTALCVSTTENNYRYQYPKTR